MSTTEAPTWTPQRWRHRRTEVTAMAYDGSEEARREIAGVVNRHAPDHAMVHASGELLVRTQLRWAAVPPGYWVGIGYNGRLWVISDEVFTGCYDPAEGENHLAIADRDQAAAIVVAADKTYEEAARRVDIPASALGMIERMRIHVHQLATTAEALR